MKFTVIGHFCLDVVHEADGREVKNYGGIVTAVLALSAAAAADDTIYPVFGIGEREFYGIKELFQQAPNIDVSGLFSYPGESNQIHIFVDEKKPIECTKHMAIPIPFAKLEPFLSVNGILINMESGRDITLEVLDEIRLAVRAKNTPIHLDLHNLTLGINPDTTRFRRAMSDWRRWCFMIHSVQLNEKEAAGLTIENFDDDALARQMLPLMVNAFCITHGANGVTLYQQEHKKLIKTHIPGTPTTVSADRIGYGDIFGALFLHRLCTTKDVVASVTEANRMTAAVVPLPGLEKFRHLTSYREER